MRVSAGSQPLKNLSQETWRQLRHFNLYRLVLAFALLVVFYNAYLTGFLGRHDPESFLATALLFLLSSFIFLILDHKKTTKLETQIIIANSSDILLITLMMHYSGGLSSGLGMLLIINIVASGTFLKSRDSFLFAAMASIAVLTEHTVAHLNNISPASLYSAAGILGIVFFASNMLATLLAKRARESEALASQRTADLISLENLNENIIQNMRTGIIVVDAKGEILMANHSAEILLGEQSLKHSQNIEEISPDLAIRFHQWSEQPNMHHNPIPQPHGLPDIQPGFRSLNKSSENIGNTLIFLEDATQLNQRFQQMKLASLGRLTASIAHEIRNPLSAINHAAQLLNESELNSSDKQLTEIINTQVQRLDKTIKNVLQLSRQEQSTPEVLPLIEWTERFIEEFRSIHNLSPGQLVFSSSINNPVILFDSSHLNQVISNLCINAINHNDKPLSEIKIQINCDYDEEQNQVYIDIIDNGPGINEQQAEEIFDPFFTTSSQGTGLGLYISKEIVESNRARIRYLDKKHMGSCFRIYFLSA
ncbi:MAG: ATP-binding protein [Gammaproteobacteria bacterium]|nr:ATP-binding protein [Gammaproteobacteria bacterium]MCW9056013.1 ATP-binding protein [Gammaproteobacteria bacterium]